MLTILKFFLVVILLGVGIAFAIANSAPVRIDLGLIMPELPLSLVVLLAVGVGLLLGIFASVFYFMRIKKENADLRRQSRLAEQEVKNLRSLPISGR